MVQSHLLASIKKIVGDKVSFNDLVAEVLDISYDAAHRRVSGKSKLSLDEAIVLANRYNLSIDGLAETTSDSIVAVEKTQTISNSKDLESYFRNSIESLNGLFQSGGEMIYSAKDIPVFYLFQGDILTRFKLYVWLKLSDDSYATTSFSEFQPSLSLLEAAKELGKVYATVPKTEIWDVTTINSVLKQIHFYFEAGLLSSTDAVELCKTLKGLINRLLRLIKDPSSDIKIYYNELLLMTNQVLVNTSQAVALYVPFTMLSFFLCTDRETTKEAVHHFDKQMQHSKLLNETGEKEQNRFANKMLQKINALETITLADTVYDFQ